jgi:hypothetical protein
METASKNLHLWIDYRPRLYQDLLVGFFRQMERRETSVNITLHTGDFEKHLTDQERVDVLVLSLDRIEPQNRLADAGFFPETRLIAFSPKGNQGWKRLGLSRQWELVRPFGLQNLLNEVLELAKQSL